MGHGVLEWSYWTIDGPSLDAGMCRVVPLAWGHLSDRTHGEVPKIKESLMTSGSLLYFKNGFRSD